jgi:hypothetical protein
MSAVFRGSSARVGKVLLAISFVGCLSSGRAADPVPPARLKEIFDAKTAAAAQQAHQRLIAQHRDDPVVAYAYALDLLRRSRQKEAADLLKQSLRDHGADHLPSWRVLMRITVTTRDPKSSASAIELSKEIVTRLNQAAAFQPDRAAAAQLVGRTAAAGEFLASPQDRDAWTKAYVAFNEQLSPALRPELIAGYDAAKSKRADLLEQIDQAAKEAADGAERAKEKADQELEDKAIEKDDFLSRIKREGDQAEAKAAAEIERRRSEITKLEAKYYGLEPDRIKLALNREGILAQMGQIQSQLTQVANSIPTADPMNAMEMTARRQAKQEADRATQTLLQRQQGLGALLAGVEVELTKILKIQSQYAVEAQGHIGEIQKVIGQINLSKADRAKAERQVQQMMKRMQNEQRITEKKNNSRTNQPVQELRRQLELWDTYLNFDLAQAREELLKPPAN